MALLTLGTNAATSLSSLLMSGNMSDVDVGTLANLMKDDKILSFPRWPGAFSQAGLLHVPNRGVLQVLPGDYVAVDTATGWPILVSARAAASGPYTHT